MYVLAALFKAKNTALSVLALILALSNTLRRVMLGDSLLIPP